MQIAGASEVTSVKCFASEARQLEVVRLLDQGHCVHDLDLESHLIWLQLQSLSQVCVNFTTWRNFTTWNRDGSLAE